MGALNQLMSYTQSQPRTRHSCGAIWDRFLRRNSSLSYSSDVLVIYSLVTNYPKTLWLKAVTMSWYLMVLWAELSGLSGEVLSIHVVFGWGYKHLRARLGWTIQDGSFTWLLTELSWGYQLESLSSHPCGFSIYFERFPAQQLDSWSIPSTNVLRGRK